MHRPALLVVADAAAAQRSGSFEVTRFHVAPSPTAKPTYGLSPCPPVQMVGKPIERPSNPRRWPYSASTRTFPGAWQSIGPWRRCFSFVGVAVTGNGATGGARVGKSTARTLARGTDEIRRVRLDEHDAVRVVSDRRSAELFDDDECDHDSATAWSDEHAVGDEARREPFVGACTSADEERSQNDEGRFHLRVVAQNRRPARARMIASVSASRAVGNRTGVDERPPPQARSRKEKRPAEEGSSNRPWSLRRTGAGDGTRTRDVHLGKVALYH